MVYGLVRTADASSRNVSAGMTYFTLFGFMGLYALVGLLYLFLFRIARAIQERGRELAVLDRYFRAGGDAQVRLLQNVDDPGRFREFMSQPMDMLHQARPELIGGTIAIDADGWFTETMAFRSEAEARQGEQMEMPDEMAQQFNREMEQVHDMRYLDLHHPWFASAGAGRM